MVLSVQETLVTEEFCHCTHLSGIVEQFTGILQYSWKLVNEIVTTVTWYKSAFKFATKTLRYPLGPFIFELTVKSSHLESKCLCGANKEQIGFMQLHQK